MVQRDDISAERARERIATLALSMYQIHGLPAPSNDELGSVVSRAEAAMSLNQLRHPDSISAAALGQIDQLVLNAAEAKKRPANLYSADAARQAQSGDGAGKNGLKAAETLERVRGASPAARSHDADSAGAATNRSDSGARYDSIGPAEWNTPKGLALTRGYALASGMAWATKQPDLMRMGQPAIQALHDAKLKGDGYEDLHGKEHLNFDNKTIVAGAEYMKRNKANYDEAAKAAAAVDGLKQLSPEERALHRETERGLLLSKPGEPERAAKQRYLEMGDKLIEHHHGDKQVASTVERERKAHHVQKGIEHKAEVKTQATEHKDQASSTQAHADAAQAQARQQTAQANQASFAAMLKAAPKV